MPWSDVLARVGQEEMQSAMKAKRLRAVVVSAAHCVVWAHSSGLFASDVNSTDDFDLVNIALIESASVSITSHAITGVQGVFLCTSTSDEFYSEAMLFGRRRLLNRRGQAGTCMKPVLFLINSTGGLTNEETVDNQCWAGLVVGDGYGIRVFQPNPSRANETLIASLSRALNKATETGWTPFGPVGTPLTSSVFSASPHFMQGGDLACSGALFSSLLLHLHPDYQKAVGILARENRASLCNIGNAFVFGLRKLDPAHVTQEMDEAQRRLSLPWCSWVPAAVSHTPPAAARAPVPLWTPPFSAAQGDARAPPGIAPVPATGLRPQTLSPFATYQELCGWASRVGLFTSDLSVIIIHEGGGPECTMDYVLENGLTSPRGTGDGKPVLFLLSADPAKVQWVGVVAGDNKGVRIFEPARSAHRQDVNKALLGKLSRWLLASMDPHAFGRIGSSLGATTSENLCPPQRVMSDGSNACCRALHAGLLLHLHLEYARLVQQLAQSYSPSAVIEEWVFGAVCIDPNNMQQEHAAVRARLQNGQQLPQSHALPSDVQHASPLPSGTPSQRPLPSGRAEAAGGARGTDKGRGGQQPVLTTPRAVGKVCEDPKHLEAHNAIEHDVNVPAHFPIGPIHSKEALLAKLKEFCGAAGFRVSVVSQRPANTQRFGGVRIGCRCKVDVAHAAAQPTAKEQFCKWAVSFEETDAGYVLVGYCTHPVPRGMTRMTHNGHAHPFELREEVMAHRQGETLPQELQIFAEQMQVGFSPAAVIHSNLLALAAKLKLPITWTRHFIYDRYARKRTEGHFDMDNMIEFLQRRQLQSGFCTKFKLQNLGDNVYEVQMVFAELDGAMEVYAAGGEDNVILFDPTHGTNKYKLKLCCFVTIGPTGANIILAFVLINTEDVSAVEWAFRCFHDCFKVAPAVLFTDSGASLISAYDALHVSGVWEDTLLMLCIFHLSKNFYESVSPVVTDRDKFHMLTNLFWRLAKESDVRSVDTFDDEWAALVDAFEEAHDPQKDSKKIDAARAWFAKLAKPTMRKRWAYRFTCQILTYLVHSTQRVESAQKAIKTRVSSPRMLAADLVTRLVEYNNHVRLEKNVSDVRLAMRQLVHSSHLPPYVSCLQLAVTPFAYEMIASQFALAHKYRAVLSTEDTTLALDSEFIVSLIPMANGRDPLLVAETCAVCEDSTVNQFGDFEDVGLRERSRNRVTTLTSCSCNFGVSSGVDVCRHRFACVLAVTSLLTDEDMVAQIFQYICKNIAGKWKRMSQVSLAALASTLRSQPATAGRADARTASACRTERTNADRYSALLGVFRTLAEQVCGSDTLTDAVEEEAMRQVTWANNGTLLNMLTEDDNDTAHGATSTTLPSVGQDAAEATPRATKPRAPRANKDSTDLKKMMGHTWQIDTRHLPEQEYYSDDDGEFQDAEPSYLLDQRIAYKWNESNKGGWALGVVDRQISTRATMNSAAKLMVQSVYGDQRERVPNFVASFAIDHTTPELVLLETNRLTVNLAKAPATSWVLLERKPLDDMEGVPAASVTFQAPRSREGRGAVKRKAPASGPTSFRRRPPAK